MTAPDITACPVIAAVKNEAQLARALESECEVVFLLFGDILSIAELTQRTADAGKYPVVHLDLIAGLSPREIAVDFIAKTTCACGLISTRPALIRRAKELGLFTVLRVFVIDSMALENIARDRALVEPDVFEILPGVMPDVLRRICASISTPVIAGGLLSQKKDVLAALVEQAKAHKGDILPGYTHLQRAQPITFGHHLMAYAMMLLRDIDRMQDAVKRMNVSPIGCCALAGTTYDTDRFFEAKQLGFDDVAQLETVPYPQLAAAYAKVAPAIAQSGGYIGGGPKKGDYFYGNPFDAGFREHAHQIPMMIGPVYGEFATFAPAAYDKNKLTAEEILEILKKVYGDNAEKVLDAFKEAYPEKNGVDVLAIDRAMREPTVKLAKLFAKGGGKAYLYNFALEFPFQHGKPAWHCSDIPYFFGNSDLVEICGIPDVSDKLESEIFGALLAFAKNGTPDHEGLPHWPEVEAEDADTMVFDRKTEVKHNYDDKVFAEINKVLKPWSFMDMMADNIQH